MQASDKLAHSSRDPVGALHRTVATVFVDRAALILEHDVPSRILFKVSEAEPVNQLCHARLPGPKPGRAKVKGAAADVFGQDAAA